MSDTARNSNPVELLLSPYELEVARLFRCGFGRGAVAAALGVSPHTVKVVLRIIRWKLGRGWEANPAYAWPEEPVRRESLPVGTPAAPENGAAGGAIAGQVDWRKLKLSGLQRFWLKPLLERLEEGGALKLLRADKEGSFAPPWAMIVYHRSGVRPAVYRVRDPDLVFGEMARFFRVELPRRAAEVRDRLAEAAALRSPRRKSELPGPEELCALLREAFGEAGERAAAGLRGRAIQDYPGSDAGF